MLHDDYILACSKLQAEEKLLKESIVTFSKKWIGSNLQDVLPEIAKDFRVISIKRENVTFCWYHPRRTKRPKWTLEKNHCRLNTFDIAPETILPDVFKGKIIETDLDTCILYDKNDHPFVADTIHFELDDENEFFEGDEIAVKKYLTNPEEFFLIK